MQGFVDDIEGLTQENRAFRHVLYTGRHLQLVLMTLTPGEEIGSETHATHDQFFRVESGMGKVRIDGVVSTIKDGSGIVVPAGARHNLSNTGSVPLRLYTIYGPPNHQDKLEQATRAEADAATESFEGVTTE